MKKFILSVCIALLACLFPFVLTACNGNPSEGAPQTVSIVAPNGAPFAALADMWGEDIEGVSADYEVITETNVRTKMLSGEADFIVAPLNVGNAVHTAYKNGSSSHDYKLMNVTSWGVLYFVTNDSAYKTRQECANVSEFLEQFSQKELLTIGEAAIPGATAKYLFQQASVTVSLKGSEATPIQQAFVSAKADDTATTTAIFAQPAITGTAAQSKGKEVKVLASVSDIYKEITGDEFPMAGMFVRADFYEEYPQFVQKLNTRIQSSVEKFNSNINAVAEKIGAMEEPPIPAAILPKAYDKMNVKFKTAADSAAAVKKLLTNIGASAADDLFIP